MDKHYDMYQDTEQMKSLDPSIDFVPRGLRTLLQSKIKSKNSVLHTAASGQAIMQSTCPRSCLAPLKVGLIGAQVWISKFSGHGQYTVLH